MKHRLLPAAALLVALSAASLGELLSVTPPAPSAPVQVAALYRSEAGPEVRTFSVPDAAAGEALLADLADDPDVLGASADALATTLEVSTASEVPSVPLATSEAAASADPRSGEQWALTRLEAAAVWDRGGGTGIVVAVLDTGVDASHPDLAGQVLPGFDAYTPETAGRVDPNGHGTHVAGIVASLRGNDQGGAGLAPGVKILPVRVLDESGSGDHSDIARGVIWAADHGADVMNLSLGGPEDTQVLRQAVAYARSKGVVVVVAAGNSAFQGNPVIYPAAYADVVSVAASSPGDSRAIFSSYGPYVDVTAPGLSILSTYPGNQYAFLSGTSMAAPYVAAAAALTLESHPSMSAASVSSRLVSSAQDLGVPGRDDEFGAGMVDPLSSRTDGVPRKAPPPDPSNPQLPLPNLPKFPAPSLPDLPNLPAPALPDLPAPSLPGLPSPSLPSLPGLPAPTLPTPSIPGRTGVSISAAPLSVGYGSATTITGGLALPAGARSGVVVELAARVAGARAYTVVASSRTDPEGRVAFSARPPKATDFVLRVVSGPLDGTTSAPVHVEVSSLVSLSFERSSKGVAYKGRVVPTAAVEVSLQELRKGTWVTVESTTSRSDGTFSFSRPRPTSSTMLRAAVSSRSGYAPGSSKPVTLLP